MYVALEPYLADIWLFTIGFFLLYYAVTDGSDLGVGLISLLSSNEEEAGTLMNTVHATLHSNQTWLVLLGGMIFGAFPFFYALVLSSLYIPIVLMLFGIILRGVSFEFRANSDNKRKWSFAFSTGSFIIALAQGFALGGLVGGLKPTTATFAEHAIEWLNPFSALIALGLIFGYVMLGANYLIMKTEGELQRRCYRYALISSVVTLAIAVAVHLLTVFKYPYVMHKWLSTPDIYVVAFFPALTVVAIVMYYASLWRRREYAPLLWNAAIVLFSFAGLSIEMYPVMIPNVVSATVTVSQAAASPGTLWFMLVVTGGLIPIILAYTSYEFWVFRGKVDPNGHEEREAV